MNKMTVGYLSVVVVILFSAAIFLSSVVNFYHIQVKNEASKNDAWLQIQKDYRYRTELISKLFTLVKQSKQHEKNFLAVLTYINHNITSLDTVPLLNNTLNRSAKQSLIKQYIEQQATISQQLNILLQYKAFKSQLNASPEIRSLFEKIKTAEDNIMEHRLVYLQSLEQYDIDLRRFPSSEIGRLQVLSEKIEFEPDPEAVTEPDTAGRSSKPVSITH